MYDIIQQYCESRDMVRIERPHPSCPHLHGYIIGLSEQLGVMWTFNDFHRDGLTIFRVLDVIGIRAEEHERFWNHMLQSEGLLAQMPSIDGVNLQSIQLALRDIQSRYGKMIVECESEDESIEDYYIGSIAHLGDDVMQFNNFNALGVWDSDSVDINYNEITLVKYMTPYLELIWRYIEGSPPAIE